jgi:NAD(P)-dependent dehydrogenase (short-subunit alcohol dehydrogenase family)
MNIILTGASKGIGFETVKIFSRDKSNNIFALARGKDGLDRLYRECSNQGAQGNLHVFPFDLVNGDYSGSLIPAILGRMNKIDILINGAGLLINKSFEQVNEDEFDLVFNANVKSAFRMIKHLVPFFAENAHIVNIGSMGGFQGSVKFPGLSLYSASKGALAILTECLAEEFKANGIKVNCLALGSAQTEMLAEAFPGYHSPLTAGEMGAFIADFSLNGHRWFNGKILPVSLATP